MLQANFNGIAAMTAGHLPALDTPSLDAPNLNAPRQLPRILPAGFGSAVWRGFRGKCPACGEGRMFRAYLKVADACPHCSEELHHHRADDFPAYLVIAITGHILVPIVLAVETEIVPALWVSVTLWPSLALIMSLSLLQPVKGAVVAIQWFGGLHGFDAAKKARQAAAATG
jgi:uncharacterized protein (DUF983 family)